MPKRSRNWDEKQSVKGRKKTKEEREINENEAAKPIKRVTDLPQELIVSISLNLHPVDILRLSQVNREFNETLQDNYLWYEFNCLHWPIDFNDQPSILKCPWRSMYLSRVKQVLRGKLLVCTIGQCTHACRTQSRFDRHKQKHSSNETKGKKQYICDICSKSCGTSGTLRQHRMKHVGYAFTCTYPGCTRGFAIASLFNDHIARHEGRSLKFRCTYDGCSYSASRRSYLKAHTQRHIVPVELRERVYCQYPGCKISFSKQYDYKLRTHERLHSTDQVHYCPEPNCSKKYAVPSELRAHMKRHQTTPHVKSSPGSQ